MSCAACRRACEHCRTASATERHEEISPRSEVDIRHPTPPNRTDVSTLARDRARLRPPPLDRDHRRVGRPAGRHQRHLPVPSAPTTGPTSRCPASETKEVQELLEANSPDRAGFTSQIVFQRPARGRRPRSAGDDGGTVRLRRGHSMTSPSRPRTTCRSRSARTATIAFAQLDIADTRTFTELTDIGNDDRRQGRRTQHGRRPRDRVRRRPLLDVRASRERDLRHHRRRHHPHPRLRFGPRHGPADRHRPVRSRHRLGAGVARQQRHHDARLHHVDGGDDRPRCRYRLRAVHRHPIPREPQTWRQRRGLRRRVDRHERSCRAVRRHHRDHRVARPVADRAGLRAGRRHRLGARRGHDDRRLAHLAAGAARLGRCPHRQHHVGGPDRRRASPWSARSSVSPPARAASSSAGSCWRSCSSASASPSSPCAASFPHRRSRSRKEQQVWYRWSRFIQHRPGWSAFVAVGFLLLLTVPLFSIRLGFGDAGNAPGGPDGAPGLRHARRRVRSRAPTARCSSPSRARRRPIPKRSAPSSRRSNAVDNVAFSVPNPISRRPRARDRLPAERTAGRGHHDPRQRPAPRRDPRVWRRREGRRLHRRLDRLRRLPQGPHAVADRRRAPAQLPVADGGVPQRARAAQGRDHEPAVDRCRLRHPRRHLPMGMGS